MWNNAQYNFWAYLILALFLALLGQCAYAQNNGFEGGNLTTWTSGGGTSNTVKTSGWSDNGVGVTVTTGIVNYSPGGGKTWTILPYGTYMASIQPGYSGSVTFDSATSSLGLTATENTAIKSYLTYQANNGGGGDPNPTNASWIKKTVTLQAGVTYTFAWNYLSTDYTPWNDGSMITLTHSSKANITPTLNNEQKRYALLGFTNPGTGNYATGSYGSTGWQVAVFTVPETGDYVLGFTAFNLGDTALSPILLIDEVQGITELNGQSFGPVAPNPGSNAPSAPAPGPTYSSDITQTQTDSMNAALARRDSLVLGNRVYFDEKTGSANNKVTIDQSSNYNTIKGLGVDTYAVLDGSNNDITIRQGDSANTTGKNLVEFSLVGSSNTVEINQARTITTGAANGNDSNGHYTRVNIAGSTNTVRTQQTNAGVGPHYMEIDLTGNNNTLLLKQNGDTTKKLFSIVNGGYNSLDINQSGTGGHYLDVTLTGNNNSATIIQKDSGSHKATINLSNNGGPSSLTLTQQGSTNQVYSISQQCANLSGCSVSVTQGP